VPLNKYGVLKGRAVNARRETRGDAPHYEIHVVAGGVAFRVAVNVKARIYPSELLFLVNNRFRHPITAALESLPEGFTSIASEPGGVALDYIRGNLFDRHDMLPLPHNLPGPDNDLSDAVDHFVRRAIEDPDAYVYAFGERWGPDRKTDEVFHFRPSNGMHDVHMNQGNDPGGWRDDGVWQDGALLLHFEASDQWVVIFLAFQSQAWHTDDRTGHALLEAAPSHDPDVIPPDEPEHDVRIMAALVNPAGPAPEHETVTLLNTTKATIDLAGWFLVDAMKHRQPLSGSIEPGKTLVVAPPLELGNQGGLISVLNRRGLKVHGVSYTKAQASREGRTIVF
jgi:uncharacterized protein YukJ